MTNGFGRPSAPLSGTAVSAFTLAFVPLGVPFLVAVVQGVIAACSPNRRGRLLGLAAVFIAACLQAATIALLVLAAVPPAVDPAATRQAQAVQHTWDDVRATAIRIQQTLRADPTVDARSIPVVHHADDRIRVTWIDDATWTVRGWTPLWGDAARDYDEFLSWGHGYDLHGAFNATGGVLDCGCGSLR